MNQETKKCQNCKNDFTIEPEDFDFYEKMKVPTPTWCWKCRFPRRLVWRNERSLYKRACSLCNKSMISMFKPEAPFPVYCHECWWSDKWDSLKFGREYDFSKTFFDQFASLQRDVPRPALYASQNVNSEYCNHTAHLKDCYLLFGSWFSENCGYGNSLQDCKNCWDCMFTLTSENCLHSIDINKCYQTHFSQNCTGCTDSAFLYDCRNCQNCLFCYNLRNQSYNVFNKQVSKEEFVRIRDSVLSSHTTLEKRFLEFQKSVREKTIHKYMVGDHNSNVSGDFIYNAKNVHASFFVEGGENDKYVVRCVKGQKDTMDTFGVNGGELGYDSNNVDFSSRVLFSLNGENNSNTEYLIDSFSAENCFGSISLNHKKYCIFNKQYNENEYFELREKIIAQMKEKPYIDKAGRKYTYGEFFPLELSPFAYNETIAQEYMPLTKKQAEELKYSWQEMGDKEYKPTKKWDELPDTIMEVDDSILKEVILCEAWDKDREKAKEHNCTMAFKITPDELAIYKKFNLPLPRKCPNTRSYEKFQLRNPVDIWHRQCMCDKKHPQHSEKCTNEFETSYSPDRPEIVYCEQCYQAEVA